MQVLVLHAAAFAAGYALARTTVARASQPLARCISLETGMQVQPVPAHADAHCQHAMQLSHSDCGFMLQSSLLAMLLASRFFPDPLARLPCGISVIVMTLVRSCLLLAAWLETRL